MNINELVSLADWIDREITQEEIVDNYMQLHNVLFFNSQPNQKKPFEEEKERLISSLKLVSLHELTLDQLRFLDYLGIKRNVGIEAVNWLEDVLFRNALDIAAAANAVDSAREDIELGVEKADTLKESLQGWSTEAVELRGEVLIRVSFANDASISNVADFKSWGAKWHEIGRGIALAHKKTPQDLRIVGAGNGSIVIELATAYAIAKTITRILTEALKVAERVLDIRLKAEQLKELKLSNQKIARDLEKEAGVEKKNGADAITQILVKQLKLKEEGDGEQIAALSKSVARMVDFLDKGGEVDLVVPDEPDPSNPDAPTLPKAVGALRESARELRQVKSNLKMLTEGQNPDA